MQGESVRITVVASMRNEGAFLLEWVAWYRMLGFTDIVVVTNNCTDHSPELLDALEAAGKVHHLRLDIKPGKPVTRAKLKLAKGHRAVRRADWVMVCDVDEFLVIHPGAGKIGDLINLTAPDCLGMAINWKVFGTSGIETYQDVPVHRQFMHSCPTKNPRSRFVKSLFRLSKYFAAIHEHAPTHFDLAKAADKGHKNLIWVNSAGKPWKGWAADAPASNTLPTHLVSHEVAQLNHYMLRSLETYRLKEGTLSPVALGNRYRDSYFQGAEAGNEIDASALRYADEFDAMLSQLRDLPQVARLHALCCADHLRAIIEKSGGRAEEDPRFLALLAASEAPGA